MAELIVDGTELVLHMTPMQQLVSFHRDLRTPLTSIRGVSPVEKPWLALRGRRMAGTALRGVAAMGTWTHSNREYDFCVVRGEQTAVQIELATGRFGRWLVGVPPGTDARAEADRLADAAGIARS